MRKKWLSILLAGAMMAGILSGCGEKKETGGGNGLTTLTWYIPAILDSADFPEIMRQVNEKLADNGIYLEFVGIDGGNYAQKMQLTDAGKEEYDLGFTSTWLNNYYNCVNNGSCLDITDLLPEHAPELYKMTSDTVWEAVKSDGKIYAVPNWQIQAKATSFGAPAEMLDAAGISIDDVNSLEDITTYMQKLHAVKPNCNKVLPAWQAAERYYGYLDVMDQGMPAVIDYRKEGKPVVFNQYETNTFEEFVRLRRSWVQDGLIFNNYLPDDVNSSTAEKKEVKERPFVIHVYAPGNDASTSNAMGYEWKSKPLSDAVLDSGGVLAALTYVSATSKHPEKAVEMLEIINTDKEIYNLLLWGLEGKHYEKTGENKIKRIENSGYTGISNFILGSQANSFLQFNQEDDTWEQLRQFNDSAVVSPILGFMPVLDDVAAECANVKTVINEQTDMLDLGLADVDTALPAFRQALKDAGVDTIIEEMQRQIDTWWENR